MRKCPKYQIGTHYSLSFFIFLPGRYCLAPPVQQGSQSDRDSQIFSFQPIDASAARLVQNPDLQSHVLEQLVPSEGKHIAAWESMRPGFLFPASGEAKHTGASKDEPQLNMMREMTDGARESFSSICPFMDGKDQCTLRNFLGQPFFCAFWGVRWHRSVLESCL
jgi:hypothetical protein